MKIRSSVGILTALTFLEGLSAFGRTSAFSPFLPSLCSDLSLSMTQIGGAYMLANLIAGLLLPSVGRSYDRCKLSYFIFVSVLVFSFSFVLLSELDADVADKMNPLNDTCRYYFNPKAEIGKWIKE